MKPLKMVTLPYVKNLETASPEFPIPVPPLELEKPKEKPSAPVRRLPRNAGTANIVKRQAKEIERVESPPPVIEAEVFVC